MVMRWIVETYTNACRAGIRSDTMPATLWDRTFRLHRDPREKSLAVHFVNLVELQTGLRLERGECANRLSRKCSTIHEKQNALRDTRLHQAIDLIHHRECLAGPGGHRKKHLPLAIRDRVFRRAIRFPLVRANAADDRSVRGALSRTRLRHCGSVIHARHPACGSAQSAVSDSAHDEHRDAISLRHSWNKETARGSRGSKRGSRFSPREYRSAWLNTFCGPSVQFLGFYNPEDLTGDA